MEELIVQAIRTSIAPGGTCKISMQIKRESDWSVINRLLGMLSAKLILMPKSQQAEYQQIWDEDNRAWDDYWNDPKNRTTTIEFTPLFVKSYSGKKEEGGEGEVERFGHFMSECLESVEAVG